MGASERRHLRRVAALGCIVCGSTAIAHHIRTGESSGTALKSSDYETIPLCNPHHTTGGYGVAIHAGQEEWERRYGTEINFLEQVRVELGIHEKSKMP